MRRRGTRAERLGRRPAAGSALVACLVLAVAACGRYGPPSRYPPEPRTGARSGEETGPIERGPVEMQPVEPEPQAEPLEEIPSPEDDGTERDDSERRQ